MRRYRARVATTLATQALPPGATGRRWMESAPLLSSRDGSGRVQLEGFGPTRGPAGALAGILMYLVLTGAGPYTMDEPSDSSDGGRPSAAGRRRRHRPRRVGRQDPVAQRQTPLIFQISPPSVATYAVFPMNSSEVGWFRPSMTTVKVPSRLTFYPVPAGLACAGHGRCRHTALLRLLIPLVACRPASPLGAGRQGASQAAPSGPVERGPCGPTASRHAAAG